FSALLTLIKKTLQNLACYMQRSSISLTKTKQLVDRKNDFFSQTRPSYTLASRKNNDLTIYHEITTKKPMNANALQTSQDIFSHRRLGTYNIDGRTCSLNSLLQALASVNGFVDLLKSNGKAVKPECDALFTTFIELIVSLRNEHSAKKNHTIDTSLFFNLLCLNRPDVFAKSLNIDICELFQIMIDIFNNATARKQVTYSSNVAEQVQTKTFLNYSFEYLNKIFSQIESQLCYATRTNLGTLTNSVMQYIDLTWLMHHNQINSTFKETFSGQFLHSNACEKSVLLSIDMLDYFPFFLVF
ncbi:unnamed protein product, partial [Didymodactylos carnosus]